MLPVNIFHYWLNGFTDLKNIYIKKRDYEKIFMPTFVFLAISAFWDPFIFFTIMDIKKGVLCHWPIYVGLHVAYIRVNEGNDRP